MPISPSDLPWWGWFLCAAIAASVFAVARALSGGLGSRATVALIIAFVSAWAGILLTGIAIVRFVKWAWME
jgi:hypothetical protein